MSTGVPQCACRRYGVVASLAVANDLFSIGGKAAVVTGGSRGIGLMIATGFVEAGAKVYISSRKAEVCEKVAAELSNVGECVALPADLSSEQACRDLAAEVTSRSGGELDILVNNAGATWGAPIDEFDAAAWDRTLNLNVKGVFHLTKFLRPALEASFASRDEPARVINIGSIDGLRTPTLETYSYSASKAAVHMLTRHLAKRLSPKVTVNAIAPGPFESQMMAATLKAAGDQMAASVPMRRIGRPD